jgi:hypothetical protein
MIAINKLGGTRIKTERRHRERGKGNSGVQKATDEKHENQRRVFLETLKANKHMAKYSLTRAVGIVSPDNFLTAFMDNPHVAECDDGSLLWVE